MISFTVPGVPAPGGSKKAFMNPRTNKIVVMDDAKNNKGWRERVAIFASQAMAGRPPLEGALRIYVVFSVVRPKGHYGTGRNAGCLKDWAKSAHPIGRPDTTKLFRALEDALTGIVWKDDAQVVSQLVIKTYTDNGPSAYIAVEPKLVFEEIDQCLSFHDLKARKSASALTS